MLCKSNISRHMANREFNFLAFLIFTIIIGSIESARFKLENRCHKAIWPGIQGGGGHQLLMNGGFQLRAGEAVSIDAPNGWSGRFWGRWHCSFDKQGQGSCLTGDCGGKLECGGAGGVPPATLAEFTLDSPMDFYDISLVDGYNIPISIIPLVEDSKFASGGATNCKPTNCTSDMNKRCPQKLQVVQEGKVVACNSACVAFNEPKYCCTGEFSNPTTCKPSAFSKVFKKACPMAYSYAYDDGTSTFTCKGANYLIRFC